MFVALVFRRQSTPAKQDDVTQFVCNRCDHSHGILKFCNINRDFSACIRGCFSEIKACCARIFVRVTSPVFLCCVVPINKELDNNRFWVNVHVSADTIHDFYHVIFRALVIVRKKR